MGVSLRGEDKAFIGTDLLEESTCMESKLEADSDNLALTEIRKTSFKANGLSSRWYSADNQARSFQY